MDRHIDEIHEYILEQFPNEAVIGIDEDDKLIKFENIADNPIEHFKVDSKEFYKHEIKMLIHSHTYLYGQKLLGEDGAQLDPRTPSLEDMQLQISLDIPFAIISTDGIECSEALFFPDLEASLTGVPYISGVYDCWSLVRRFHYQEDGTVLPDYPRVSKIIPHHAN